MFNKSLIVFTLLFISIFCAGCEANSFNDSAPLSDTISESGTTDSNGNDTKDPQIPEINDGNVWISKQYEEKLHNLNVTITYPQIVSSQDQMAEKINEVIENSAINEYYNHWNLEGLTLDQTYNIEKQEKDLLSIVFYGYAYVAGTAYPTAACHAVTINLETGEKYDLSDFLESYEYLERSIIDNKYEVLYGGLKARTSDRILDVVSNSFDKIPIEQNTQKFYISEDGSICIIIDLPHAGGDYSVLCIS